MAEELDVVDDAAVGAGDAVGFEALADAPGEIGQFVEAIDGEFLAVAADEVEPVAAPGDIAVDAADAGGLDGDVSRAPVAGDVAEGDGSIGVEVRLDDAGRGFDAADAMANAGNPAPDVRARLSSHRHR